MGAAQSQFIIGEGRNPSEENARFAPVIAAGWIFERSPSIFATERGFDPRKQKIEPFNRSQMPKMKSTETMSDCAQEPPRIAFHEFKNMRQEPGGRRRWLDDCVLLAGTKRP